ncbi:hypothetical protein SI859A1_02640 [Aurantimonas manganoxydans SI85-9A1]|uniref:Uncharacterized protein n=1 Tax=Aurantimonas manganoxydans (strain ATCC BAA-1229 / DSM 21871 / SI85-9A1) TaxID=287752 RepID=Q1YLA7_AURMS|nr:hypothetical protein SI859A1_02640 [Aurantimonas manganoxydans SI85-9A1]
MQRDADLRREVDLRPVEGEAPGQRLAQALDHGVHIRQGRRPVDDDDEAVLAEMTGDVAGGQMVAQFGGEGVRQPLAGHVAELGAHGGEFADVDDDDREAPGRAGCGEVGQPRLHEALVVEAGGGVEFQPFLQRFGPGPGAPGGLVTVDRAAHGADQFGDLQIPLRNIVAEAAAEGLDRGPLAAAAGQHDDGRRVRQHGIDALGNRQAVVLSEVVIHEDAVERLLAEGLEQRGLRFQTGHPHSALQGQKIGDIVEKERVIVYDGEADIAVHMQSVRLPGPGICPRMGVGPDNVGSALRMN